MSNHLAIATVTATLQRILQAAIPNDLTSANVTTLAPNNLGKSETQKGVNIYLYQVIFNRVQGNPVDARFRNRKGELAERSRTALDLHYIISFFGNEALFEPQRLLGSVVRALSDRAILTGEMINEVVSSLENAYLAESNLNEQVEEIIFVPIDLSLEDLTRIWSVFFQTSYMLSLAYKATVVIVEGEEPGKKALPVQTRSSTGLVPFSKMPVIDEVISVAGKLEPIVADSSLQIRGKQLASRYTTVRIGTVEVTPSQVTASNITLPLAAVPAGALRAGVQSVQVIQRLSPGNEANGHHRIESNVAPFVLRPTIKGVRAIKVEDDPILGQLTEVEVLVNLPLGTQQQLVLALNEYQTENATAYLFEAPPRIEETNLITIPIPGAKPGEYLVRLHVDGAESLLTVDTEPSSPTYNWYVGPRIEITNNK